MISRVRKTGWTRLSAWPVLAFFLFMETAGQSFALALTAQSAGLNAPAASSSKSSFPDWLRLLPSETAKVESIQETKKEGPFVVLIQDAHSNPGAQRNIAQVLEYLAERQSDSGGRLFIAVEGAQGDLHPEYFDFFPEFTDAGDAVVENLLALGELSGAELFAWSRYKQHKANPDAQAPDSVFFRGVETTELYRQNFAAYRELLSSRAAFSGQLENAERTLRSRMSQSLNPELARFYKERDKRKNGQFGLRRKDSGPGDLSVYASYLKEQSKSVLGIQLEDPVEQLRFPNFVRLLKLKQNQSDLAHPEIAQAWKAFADRLSETPETRALAAAFVKLGAGFGISEKGLSPDLALDTEEISPRKLLEEFERAGAALGYSWKDNEVLAAALKAIVLQSEIDTSFLFEEMERLENAVIEKLARTDEEKKEVLRIRDFEGFKRLLYLEMTRLDLDRMKSSQPNYSGLLNGLVEEKDRETLLALASRALVFYRQARARDEALVMNALDFSRNAALNAAGAGSARPVLVLISGGFHAEGIQEILREREMDFGLVTPRITETDQGQRYARVMSGENANLEVYFKTAQPFSTRQQALLFREAMETAIPLWLNSGHSPNEVETFEKLFREHPVLSQTLKLETQESPALSFVFTAEQGQEPQGAQAAAISAPLLSADPVFNQRVERRIVPGKSQPYRWKSSRRLTSGRPAAEGGVRSELRSGEKPYAEALQFTSRPVVTSLGDSAKVEITFKTDQATLDESEMFFHWGAYNQGPVDWIDHEVLSWDIQSLGGDVYKATKVIQPGKTGDFGVTAYAQNKATGQRIWQGTTRADDALIHIDLPKETALQDLRRNLKKQEAISAIRKSLSSSAAYQDFIKTIHDLVVKEKIRGIGKVVYDATKDVPRFRAEISKIYERLKSESVTWNNVYREAATPALQALETLGIGESVFVAPEGPHAIAGGLAKVIEGLPKELSKSGISVTVITPLYEQSQGDKHPSAETLLQKGFETDGKRVLIGSEPVGKVGVTFGPTYESGTQLTGLRDEQIRAFKRNVESRVYEADAGGVRYLFLRHPNLEDKLYAKVSSSEELRRAIFLSRAALEILQDRSFDVDPQLVISNDWVTGLIPALLHDDPQYAEDPALKSVGTLHMVHNQGSVYQGRVFTNQYGVDLWPLIGLDHSYYQDNADPNDDRFLNITASAMRNVNRAVLAVSRPSAEQMITPEGGEGLDGILKPIQDILFGVSNGIDTAEARRVFWRKGEEAREALGLPRLLETYEDKSFLSNLPEYKKSALSKTQKEFGLDQNKDAIFLSMIGRVAEQKGIQLLTETQEGVSVLESLLRMNPDVQIIIGGPLPPADKEEEKKPEDQRKASSDPEAEKLYRLTLQLEKKYPGRIRGAFTFLPSQVALQVMLASSFFLMPSRYEPGGITQLESLAAGTPVIARNVGGIAATLINYLQDPAHGNGFLFEDFTGTALRGTLENALRIVSENPGLFETLSLRAAQANNDWRDRMPQYEALLQFSAGVLTPAEEGGFDTDYAYLRPRIETLENIRPSNRSELRTEGGVTTPEEFALKVNRYAANLEAQRKDRDGLDGVNYLTDPLRDFLLSSTELIGIMSRDPDKAMQARRFWTDPAQRELAERTLSWLTALLNGRKSTDDEKLLERDLLAAGQEDLWTVLISYKSSNLFSPVREFEKIPLTIHFDAALLEGHFALDKETLPQPAKDEPSVTDLWFVYDPHSVLGLVGSHSENGISPHAKGGIRYISPADAEGNFLNLRLYMSLFKDPTGKNITQQGVIVDLFDLVRAQETKNMLGTEFQGAKAEYTYLPGSNDAAAFKKFSAAFIDAGILEHEVPGPDIGMSGDKVQTGIEEARRIVLRHLSRELEFLGLLVSDSLPGEADLKQLGMTAEQLSLARQVFKMNFSDVKDPVLVYEQALDIVEGFSTTRFLHNSIHRLLRMYLIRDYFRDLDLGPLKNRDPFMNNTDELAVYFQQTLNSLRRKDPAFSKHEFRRDYAVKKSPELLELFDKVLGAMITGGRSDKGAIDHVISAITAKGVYNAYLRTRDYLVKIGSLKKDIPVRLAFNGAGDVGGSAALMAARGGDLVVMMQDVNGAVYSKKGFSVAKLQEFNNIPPAKRNVVEFFGRIPGAIPMNRESLFSGSPEHDIDVLVTAATANTVNEENVEALIRGGLKAIVEGGNNTYKKVAGRLAQAGIVTAWGSTANVGGVIASSRENQAKHRLSIAELTLPTLQSLPDGRVLTATLEGHQTTLPLIRESPKGSKQKTRAVLELRDDRVIKPAKLFPDLPLNTLVDVVEVATPEGPVWKAYVNNMEVGEVDSKGFVQRLRFLVDGETLFVEVRDGQVTKINPALPDLRQGPVRVRYPARERKYETYQFVGDIIDAYQTVVLALVEKGNPERDSIQVQRALSKAIAEKKKEIMTSPAFAEERQAAVQKLMDSGYIATPEELLHVASSALARSLMLATIKAEDGTLAYVETENPFTGARIRVSKDFDVVELSEGARSELRSTPSNPYEIVAQKIQAAKERLLPRYSEDPYFEDFFEEVQWMFPLDHLAAKTVSVERLERQIETAYRLFVQHISDATISFQVHSANPREADLTEFVVVSDNRPGLLGDVGGAIGTGGGDIQESYFRVIRNPLNNREVAVNFFEVTNKAKKALDSTARENTEKKILETLQKHSEAQKQENRISGMMKNRDTLLQGEVATFLSSDGDLEAVAYDVFEDMRENRDIEDIRKVSERLRQDMTKLYDAAQQIIHELDVPGLLPDSGDVELTEVKLSAMKDYVDFLLRETVRLVMRPVQKTAAHRQDAGSIFLNLVRAHMVKAEDSGAPVHGLLASEIHYVAKIVLDQMRPDISVVNLEEPRDVQTAQIQAEKNNFTEAVEAALKLQPGAVSEELKDRLAGLDAMVRESISEQILKRIEGNPEAKKAEEVMPLKAVRAIPLVVLPLIEAWRAEGARAGSQKMLDNAKDLEIIFKQVIKLLRKQGGEGESLGVVNVDKELILFAHELDPFKLIRLTKEYRIKAIVTDGAGFASHWVLVAENLNIPVFIVDQGQSGFDLLDTAWIGRRAILDGRGPGNKPVLILNPGEATQTEYKPRLEVQVALDRIAMRHAHEKAVSGGGQEVAFFANADTPEELVQAFDYYGAEGDGLDRTEYLFQSKNVALTRYLENPNKETEEALRTSFQNIFSEMSQSTRSGEVTIRMFDMQRDKEDAAFSLINPGKIYGPAYYRTPVGNRLLRIEIEAAIRANAESSRGQIKVLFPMFRSPQDLIALLNERGSIRKDLKDLTPEEQGILNDVAKEDAAFMVGLFDEIRQKVIDDKDSLTGMASRHKALAKPLAKYNEEEPTVEKIQQLIGQMKRGIMVETVEGLEILDAMFPIVDFFSVGTNDLTISLFREEGISREHNPEYFDHVEFKVFEAIQNRIFDVVQAKNRELKDAGQERQVTVTVCGGLACMDTFVLMALHKALPDRQLQLSGSAGLIPALKEIVRKARPEDSAFVAAAKNTAELTAGAAKALEEIRNRQLESGEYLAELKAVQKGVPVPALSDEVRSEVMEEYGVEEDIAGGLLELKRKEAETAAGAVEKTAEIRSATKYLLGPVGLHMFPAQKIAPFLAKNKAVKMEIKRETGDTVTINTPLDLMMGFAEFSEVEVVLQGPEAQVRELERLLVTIPEPDHDMVPTFSTQFARRQYSVPSESLTDSAISTLQTLMETLPKAPDLAGYIHTQSGRFIALSNSKALKDLKFEKDEKIEIVWLGEASEEAREKLEALRDGENPIFLSTETPKPAAPIKLEKEYFVGPLGLHMLPPMQIKAKLAKLPELRAFLTSTTNKVVDMRNAVELMGLGTATLLQKVKIVLEGPEAQVAEFEKFLETELFEESYENVLVFSKDSAQGYFQLNPELSEENLVSALQNVKGQFPQAAFFVRFSNETSTHLSSEGDVRNYFKEFSKPVRLYTAGEGAQAALQALTDFKGEEKALFSREAESKTFDILLGPVGLHMIPVTMIAKYLREHKALKVSFDVPGVGVVDASNPLSLMTLAAPAFGTLKIIATGSSDEVSDFETYLSEKIVEADYDGVPAFNAEFSGRTYKVTGTALPESVVTSVQEILNAQAPYPKFSGFLYKDDRVVPLQNKAKLTDLVFGAEQPPFSLYFLGPNAEQALQALEDIQLDGVPVFIPQGEKILPAGNARSELRLAGDEMVSTRDWEMRLREMAAGFTSLSAPETFGPSEQAVVVDVSQQLGGIYSEEEVANRLPADTAVRFSGRSESLYLPGADAGRLWVMNHVATENGLFQEAGVSDPELLQMLSKLPGLPDQRPLEQGAAGFSASIHVQLDQTPERTALLPVLAVAVSVNGALHLNISSLNETQASALEKELRELAASKAMRFKAGQITVTGNLQGAVFASVPQNKFDEKDKHALLGKEDDFRGVRKRKGQNLFNLDAAAVKNPGLFASTVITVLQAMALGKQPEEYFQILDPRMLDPDHFTDLLQTVTAYLAAQTSIQTAA